MDRIFSGIQPTGNLHLGNYLGAIRNWVQMQNTEQETLFCLVDLHAITTYQNPQKLQQNILDMTATLLACGINPQKSTLFVQSANPHHTELCWLLSSIARMGWLNRMTQFKEKAGKDRENASIGLYIYPILMAADILLYHANIVPVGEDQTQHLELTRDIAQKFNHDYGQEFFPYVRTDLQKIATRIMSLRDGTSKMSKSAPSDMTRIFLSDHADRIAEKIKKAKTDALPLPDNITEFTERAEAKNLMIIYAAISGISFQDAAEKWAGKKFSAFKPALSDLLIAHICPIGAEIKKIQADETNLRQILAKGAEKAQSLSLPIIEQTRKIIGVQKM